MGFVLLQISMHSNMPIEQNFQAPILAHPNNLLIFIECFCLQIGDSSADMGFSNGKYLFKQIKANFKAVISSGSIFSISEVKDKEKTGHELFKAPSFLAANAY